MGENSERRAARFPSSAPVWTVHENILPVQESKGDLTNSNTLGSPQELLPRWQQTSVGWKHWAVTESSSLLPLSRKIQKESWDYARGTPGGTPTRAASSLPSSSCWPHSQQQTGSSCLAPPPLEIFLVRLCILVLTASSKSQDQWQTTPPKSSGQGLWRVSLPFCHLWGPLLPASRTTLCHDDDCIWLFCCLVWKREMVPWEKHSWHKLRSPALRVKGWTRWQRCGWGTEWTLTDLGSSQVLISKMDNTSSKMHLNKHRETYIYIWRNSLRNEYHRCPHLLSQRRQQTTQKPQTVLSHLYKSCKWLEHILKRVCGQSPACVNATEYKYTALHWLSHSAKWSYGTTVTWAVPHWPRQHYTAWTYQDGEIHWYRILG